MTKSDKKYTRKNFLAYARAMANISKKLKDARLKSGLTQDEAATKMGIHKNSLINYEKGRRVPNAKLVGLFAQLYGVDSDWLIQSGDGPMPAVSNEFLDKYEMLSDTQKRIIADIVDEFSKSHVLESSVD